MPPTPLLRGVSYRIFREEREDFRQTLWGFTMYEDGRQVMIQSGYTTRRKAKQAADWAERTRAWEHSKLVGS